MRACLFSPTFIFKIITNFDSYVHGYVNQGVKRIVFCSSMARYGDQQPPFVESMRPQPVDPYGIAEVAAEDTLRTCKGS